MKRTFPHFDRNGVVLLFSSKYGNSALYVFRAFGSDYNNINRGMLRRSRCALIFLQTVLFVALLSLD